MTPASCDAVVLCGISNDFSLLSPSFRQVAYVLLTRPPLKLEKNPQTSIIVNYSICLLHPIQVSVRLACLKCAASVHPEPESNSCLNSRSVTFLLPLFTLFVRFVMLIITLAWLYLLFIFQCALFALHRCEQDRF